MGVHAGALHAIGMTAHSGAAAGAGAGTYAGAAGIMVTVEGEEKMGVDCNIRAVLEDLRCGSPDWIPSSVLAPPLQ